VNSDDAADPATDDSPDHQAKEEEANYESPPCRIAPLMTHWIIQS
jgi:hypothetical protein